MGDGDKFGEVEKNPSKKENLSKLNLFRERFLTPETSLMFTRFWKVFTKALILQHFDSKRHIVIETNVSSFDIGKIFCQIISSHMTYTNLDVFTFEIGQLHLVTFLPWKMIRAETWYKTNDGELLAIVEVFQTWRHYLKGCKYKLFVLIDHNNFRQSMDIKNLSVR